MSAPRSERPLILLLAFTAVGLVVVVAFLSISRCTHRKKD